MKAYRVATRCSELEGLRATMGAMVKAILPCCLPCRKASEGQEARHDSKARDTCHCGAPFVFLSRHLRSAFGAKLTLSGKQNRLN